MKITTRLPKYRYSYIFVQFFSHTYDLNMGTYFSITRNYAFTVILSEMLYKCSYAITQVKTWPASN